VSGAAEFEYMLPVVPLARVYWPDRRLARSPLDELYAPPTLRLLRQSRSSREFGLQVKERDTYNSPKAIICKVIVRREGVVAK
jgi:hypothetical protein